MILICYILFVLGVCILVTHLERRPLNSLFRGLMYKQFYKDEEGNVVVYLAHTHLPVHPDFRLYLSTSVPLHIKGTK